MLRKLTRELHMGKVWLSDRMFVLQTDDNKCHVKSSQRLINPTITVLEILKTTCSIFISFSHLCTSKKQFQHVQFSALSYNINCLCPVVQNVLQWVSIEKSHPHNI